LRIGNVTGLVVEVSVLMAWTIVKINIGAHCVGLHFGSTQPTFFYIFGHATGDLTPPQTPPLRGEGLSGSPFPCREGGWGVRSRIVDKA